MTEHNRQIEGHGSAVRTRRVSLLCVRRMSRSRAIGRHRSGSGQPASRGPERVVLRSLGARPPRAHPRILPAAVIACAALLAAVPAAHAAVAPTALRTRVGDHAAFVRVVVDFTAGALPTPTEMLLATDPDPFPDGVVRLRLDRRGIRTEAGPARAHGVTVVARQRGNNRIVVRVAAARHRLKYLSYLALKRPDRLVIALWKSAPPVAAAEVRRAATGCLALTRVAAGTRTVVVSGRARDLFENALLVRLRAADGRVLAQRPEISEPPETDGRWSTRLRYPAVSRQAATLEAVAQSAKDGALACIVQVNVGIGSRVSVRPGEHPRRGASGPSRKARWRHPGPRTQPSRREVLKCSAFASR